MKSIGISLRASDKYTEVSNQDNPIHLHINLWKSPPRFRVKKIKDPFYLDIGIMAKFLTNELKIYLPFELKEEEAYEDLGQILIDNKPILCALFNDDYNINQIESGCYHLVSVISKNNEKKSIVSKFKYIFVNKILNNEKKFTLKNKRKNELPDPFYLYTLGADDITAQKCREKHTGGWMLSIKVPNQEGFPPEDYYYIRFRVVITNPIGLALQTDLSNDLIQSAFTKLDMYNLQFNELRDIPYGPKGLLKADNFSFAAFSKIHILYISTPKVSVESGSSAKSDSKLIAPQKWRSYLPEGYTLDTYVAHHWKLYNKDGSSFRKRDLFFSAKYPKLQLLTFLAYISVIVILGCIGSILASLTCAQGSLNFGIFGFSIIIFLVFYCVIWYLCKYWKLP